MQYGQLFGFGKINRDLAPDKRDTKTHFDVVNFETYFTDRGMSLKAASGTTTGTTFSASPGSYPPTGPGDIDPGPTPFAIMPYYIIGDGYIEDRLFIFVTARGPIAGENDIVPLCKIMEVIDNGSGNITLPLITFGEFYFNTANPIECVGYKDSDSSKLYWVDGLNQSRYVDVDNPSGEIDYVIANDTIGDITVSSYTALKGSRNIRAKYAFATYNLGDTSSKLSASTNPINISIEFYSAEIVITNLPLKYSNIRVYRLEYFEYNTAPSFILIKETSYLPGDIITLVDNGSLFVSQVSLETIFALGSDIIIPGTLETKKQQLFFGNTIVEPFKIDPAFWDARAYAFRVNSPSFLLRTESNPSSVVYNDYNVPLEHDAIVVNPRWQDQYLKNSTVRGVEGPNIKIEVREAFSAEFTVGVSFKQGETYRIGVQGQDEFLRWSQVLWVTDLTIPYLGTAISVNATVLNGLTGVLKWRFVYVERENKDKTVLAQGAPQPVLHFKQFDGTPLGNQPHPNVKTKNNLADVNNVFQIQKAYNKEQGAGNSVDYPYRQADQEYDIDNLGLNINLLMTPETAISPFELPVTGIRLIGGIKIRHTSSYAKLVDDNTTGEKHNFDTFILGNLTTEIYPTTIWRPIFRLDEDKTRMPSVIFDVFHSNTWVSDNKTRVTYMYTRENNGNLILNAESNLTEWAVDESVFIGNDDTVVLDGQVIDNSVDYSPYQVRYAGIDLTFFESEGSSKYGFVVTNGGWQGSSAIDPDGLGYGTYSNFPTVTGTDSLLPIIEFIRENPNQYGGQSYTTKTTNIYIDASEGIDVGVEVKLSGDTYAGQYGFAWNTGARKNLERRYSVMYDYIWVNMESSVQAREFNWKLTPKEPTRSLQESRIALEAKNWERYAQVFSQVPNALQQAATPFNFIEIVNYPTRIIPSGIKIPGGQTDAWTEILSSVWIDLENVYGPIIKLVKVGDNMLAFQPKAIAVIKIYPIAQTTTQSGAINLGKGKVLDDFTYLNVEKGCSHPEALRVIDEKVFFIDSLNKSLNELKLSEISTLLGFTSLMQQVSFDGPSRDPIGIFVYLDRLKDDIHFAFPGQASLVFNYTNNAFSHRRTYQGAHHFIGFQDRTYAAFGQSLFRLDKGVIGNYFGTHFDARIDMWVEPFPGKDKVFDSVEFSKESTDTINEVQVDTPTRTSGLQVADIKSKFDIHTLRLPRVENTRDRWRERNVRIKLIYKGIVEFFLDRLRVKFSIKK